MLVNELVIGNFSDRRMRILFSCRPALGHVYPLIPLAMAAREAGHRVVFGTGAAFVPRLRRLDFEAYPVGIAVSEAEAQARRQLGDADPLELILTMFGDVLARRTLADLVPLLAELRPDLVVYEQSPGRRHRSGQIRSTPMSLRVAPSNHFAYSHEAGGPDHVAGQSFCGK
ncbi:glycosyltransferase family 1 protein [Planosporangium mesophilum]|uniref:Glycosyltransferase n=1 Tax=Planosporangium mesophilum TaxID=689768 RepID=A0A8J3X251_9ACTN|nr:glycosyltransferase family 1 protein [Planosporangium mesophilum]NJC86427.1 glycosyltransferase family 1 protein [Planosporangium mesophilum]GII25132.1 hypothetical protein Pme01_47290 [Planosporangium mesophilum]